MDFWNREILRAAPFFTRLRLDQLTRRILCRRGFYLRGTARMLRRVDRLAQRRADLERRLLAFEKGDL